MFRCLLPAAALALLVPPAAPAVPIVPLPDARPPAAKDGWSGVYTRLGGFDMPDRARHVSITKDGHGYRIGLKGYEQARFVEVRPGVLQCEELGTISRGTLTAEGREPVPVLTAHFCYEQFYLFGPN